MSDSGNEGDISADEQENPTEIPTAVTEVEIPIAVTQEAISEKPDDLVELQKESESPIELKLAEDGSAEEKKVEDNESINRNVEIEPKEVMEEGDTEALEIEQVKEVSSKEDEIVDPDRKEVLGKELKEVEDEVEVEREEIQTEVDIDEKDVSQDQDEKDEGETKVETEQPKEEKPEDQDIEPEEDITETKIDEKEIMAPETDEEAAPKKKQVTHEDEVKKEEKLDMPTDETDIETTEGDETDYEGVKKEDESEQALEELPASTRKKYKSRKSIKSDGSRRSKVSSTFSGEEDVEVEDEFSEEEEEEEIEEEEEPEHYDAEGFLSGPTICEGGTLPLDILEFFHSFGYNCRKKFNLEVLDENTVVFASGNFLHFFNLETKDIWFRRSALGQGIGHIKRNPNKEYSHFAVAECGRRPIIILYNWPEMTILCILRGGAKKLYSNMDYSPDGELLVSQSGEPDYLITVWNWKEHKILLRNKSYVNDVYSVKFSPYIPGEITTCGVGHIKFWKMARTFTGLKLQGELGRFGKTEYSDILGVLPMPDEKVVSGCDWGNILIWDGGLITLEVLRTLRKNCHEAPIVQIFYEDEELWTVSLDGHVRIWWYEKIDRADPPDDDRVILLDPSYDFYTPGMSLYQVTRRREEESMFIAQDGNGGIWQIDLNTVTEPEPSMQLYKCHAGKVVDIATYCNGRYLASLGRDGRLYIYNYLMKKLVFGYEFPAKGSRMIWPEAELLPTGDVILAGFCDGQVRVCVLNLKNEENISLTVTQVIKPHNKPLTAIEINSRASIVITGAEDSTIFVFAVNSLQNMDEFLIPIGFIPAPDSVTCLTWYPKTDHTILVGCLHGQMMEVEVPKTPQVYTGVSYLLKVQPKYQNFMSYKSQIRRNIYLKKVAKRKAKKVEVKRIEMERIMKENPALEIDEEVFLADSESEEELEPLYIPEVRNRILWMRYTPDQTIWVSMAGYDAGYIYEYKMDQHDEVPYRFKMVHDADDTEISYYIIDEQQKYLILAMQDGSLRVNRINRKDFRDLKDYWSYTLHDNQYGFVSKLCFSHDQKFLFSCGEDGNVFAMVFHHETYVPPLVIRPMIRISPLVSVEDVDPYTKLSLEETKIKAEEDRIMKAANAHKANVRDILKGLKERYQKLLSRNNKLLPSQIIPRQELELDDRVLQYINNDFQSKLDLVQRKLAYDLEKSEVQMKKLLKYFTDPCDMHPVQISGINDPSLYLLTVRQRMMSPMFPTVLKICEEKIEEEKRKGRPPERVQVQAKIPVPKPSKQMALEYFLLSLTPSQIQNKLGPKLTRLLNKYRARREKWDRRADEWEEFKARRPDPNKNHPDDEKFLQEAMNNVGYYKLKEADDYKPSPDERETTVKKYKQVLDTRLKQYNLRHNFIKSVYDVRDLKYQAIDKLKEYREYLRELHEELPVSLHQFGPNIPNVDSNEFPEEKLKPHIILEEKEESIESGYILQEYVPEPTIFQRERQLLPQRTTYPKINSDNIFIPTYSSNEIANVLEMEFDSLLNKYSDEVDTPMESELRAKRLTRKLFFQSTTIANMNRTIEEFNQVIEEGKKARLPVHPRGNFVDIYILTLNQELNILKQFEDGEDSLQNKVNKCLQQVHAMEDDIDVEKNKKLDIEHEIESNRVEEMKIQEKFKHVTETNKYYDFLKKVFRKRFRPPKQATDSDSDSESSSSSSEDTEEDDSASIDSRDFGFIKQDLNVCPKGCEQAIFDLTVELRGNRHSIEQNTKELQRVVDTINKNIDLSNRKLRIVQSQYQQSINSLEAYQKEKQRLLNQVRCTVVLNLDQIHDYNPETDEISDYLVFSRSTLSSLYKRVGGLEYENLQQKTKYETYLEHITRMRKDLRYMRSRIKRLMQTIQQMMCEKFGKVVDINELELAMIKKTFNKTHINELEEVVLKKLVFDVRLKNTNIKDVYAAQIRQMTTRIQDCQEDLIRTIQGNTNRLELLQVMNREKKDLVKAIASQSKRRDKLEHNVTASAQCDKDIKKLESIVEDQNKTIFNLKAEIKMLKTKGMPPKERYVEPTSTEEVELISESIKEWPEIEKYLESTREEPAEERTLQEIEMPGFYLTETEDIITNLIHEILGTMKVRSKVVADAELVVRKILSHILNCVTVQQVINEIVSNLPCELTTKQRSLVESSAEKIFTIQKPDMSEESIIQYAKELLEDSVEEILQKNDEPYELVAELLENLVESMPKEFLFHEKSLNSLVDKLGSFIGEHKLERDALTSKIERISGENRNEILAILDVILKEVYGTGIDYMYVIKRK